MSRWTERNQQTLRKHQIRVNAKIGCLEHVCESVRVGAPLIDVLREPAEALAVALSLQHAAHEHLQRPRVQLLERDVALHTNTVTCLCYNEHMQIQSLPLGGAYGAVNAKTLTNPHR